MTMQLSRRRMLMQALFGSGLVGLRSLASGIPQALLKNPRAKLDAAACAANAQYVVFSSSGSGDPLNANVPKTYDFADISHSPDPTMAATPMTIGGQQYTAAAPWASLPQNVLDRTCFFHHGTYTVVHPDISKVLRLEDVTNPHEQLPSLLAKNLAPCLGTVQTEPISLGPLLTIDSRPQPVLQPRALAALLASPTGALGRLQQLRDADLDALNELYKQEGNDAQKAFLDQYALSQQQARLISENLLTTLQSIKDNSPASQVLAGVTLIQMNVSPAIGINIPFGGDNHVDTNLANETAQTVAGVATINQLMTQLAAANLQDKVTFMTLNVFGRTLTKSTAGRQHHGDHHCMVMIGKGIKGSVVGGLESVSGDYRAQSIDSASGNGVAKNGGDVIFAETLAAAGKTLGVACGVPDSVLETSITGGKPIPAALAT